MSFQTFIDQKDPKNQHFWGQILGENSKNVCTLYAISQKVLGIFTLSKKVLKSAEQVGFEI